MEQLLFMGLLYVVKVLHVVLEIFHSENPGENQDYTEEPPW
jgi:hypothetical protein